MEDWNEGLLVLEEWRSYRGSRWWLYMPAKAKQSFFCDWRRGREEKAHGPQDKVRLQVVISEMSKCMTLPTSELADIRNNLYLYSTTTILVGSYWTQRGKFFSIAQTWKVFFFSGLSHDDDDDSFCILQPRISWCTCIPFNILISLFGFVFLSFAI